MSVHRSRLFRSGNSQAVRLPKEVAFEGDGEVLVVRSGDVVTIYRATTSVHEMADQLLAREPILEVERREADEPTDRPGL